MNYPVGLIRKNDGVTLACIDDMRMPPNASARPNFKKLREFKNGRSSGVPKWRL
jgi:hypothetical protein